MNDPHVVSLHYNFEHQPSIDFGKADPLHHGESHSTVPSWDREMSASSFRNTSARQEQKTRPRIAAAQKC